MKILFPKWNYGYKILQRLKAWSILDWGQGERYQMKLAVQKKGEFLNTSCTLAKTLQGFEDWSELILLSGRETQFKTNMLFPLHSLSSLTRIRDNKV